MEELVEHPIEIVKKRTLISKHFLKLMKKRTIMKAVMMLQTTAMTTMMSETSKRKTLSYLVIGMVVCVLVDAE